MYPFIYIFGRVLPVYGLVGTAGVLLGGFAAYRRGKRHGAQVNADDALFMYIYGAIGAAAGAKLFSLMQNLPSLIGDLVLIFSDPDLFFARYISGGMVFYGGLLGAVAGAAVYVRQYRLAPSPLFAALIPVIPLVHAVGRVACFMAGCCYGIETHALGLPAADGRLRFPVQLCESAANIALYFFLSAVSRRRRDDGRLVTALYFMSYSVLRFALEFLRGDTARGFVGPLSTGQAVSIAVFASGVLLMFLRRVKHINICQFTS